MKNEIIIDSNTYYPNPVTLTTLLAVKSLKTTLSNGHYSKWLRGEIAEDGLMVEIVNMIAHFRVYIPDILKDVKLPENVKDIMDSKPDKVVFNLIKSYRKEFMAWYAEETKDIYAMYQDIFKEEEESTEKK